jgi:hypothetical protein
MLLYCQELRKLDNNFDSLEYLHILRGKNKIMDELAKLGSSRAMVPTGVFVGAPWAKHFESLSQGYQGGQVILGGSLTEQEHNRVT